MDARTGEIVRGSETDMLERLKDAMIPIDEEDMTKKQSMESRVSLHDHRSKLGAELTRRRKELGLDSKNYRRRLRRQGKLS